MRGSTAKKAAEVTCTRQYLAELILGRLLTAGVIEDAGRVEPVCVSRSGRAGKVILKGERGLPEEDLRPVSPILWQKEWIFALADRFAEGMPIHQETFATHSCFLSVKGELLFECEDIGRHNAFDKVIGYALRHKIDLGQCIVYLSGRIPADMAVKAVRAGILVLAAKAAATREAAGIAGRYGLTLICSARRDVLRVLAP